MPSTNEAKREKYRLEQAGQQRSSAAAQTAPQTISRAPVQAQPPSSPSLAPTTPQFLQAGNGGQAVQPPERLIFDHVFGWPAANQPMYTALDERGRRWAVKWTDSSFGLAVDEYNAAVIADELFPTRLRVPPVILTTPEFLAENRLPCGDPDTLDYYRLSDPTAPPTGTHQELSGSGSWETTSPRGPIDHDDFAWNTEESPQPILMLWVEDAPSEDDIVDSLSDAEYTAYQTSRENRFTPLDVFGNYTAATRGIFDLLILNHDRHGGNYLFPNVLGGQVLIDNQFSLQVREEYQHILSDATKRRLAAQALYDFADTQWAALGNAPAAYGAFRTQVLEPIAKLRRPRVKRILDRMVAPDEFKEAYGKYLASCGRVARLLLKEADQAVVERASGSQGG